MKKSHLEAKKRMESTHDVSASAELDKIKSISKWLSIKVRDYNEEGADAFINSSNITPPPIVIEETPFIIIDL